MSTKELEKNSSAITKAEKPTLSNRFVEKVSQEFVSAVGEASGFGEHEKKLAVNFYIHADNALKQFEAKRIDDAKDTLPFIWENVNMAKLAVEAVHRIRVGLDALIPNHLHLIPYYNKRTKKYDMDVRIGYEGKLYMAKKYSVQEIVDIRVHLVHEKDEFTLMVISGDNPSENFEFTRAPFNQGEVVGGFAFIRYKDESLNKVVTCDDDYFKKIQGEVKTNAFWGKWGNKMKKKTVALRAFDEVDIDPQKTNSSFHVVQQADNPFVEPGKEKEEVDISADEVDFQEVATPEIEAKSVPKVSSEQRVFEVNMDDFEKKDDGLPF